MQNRSAGKTVKRRGIRSLSDPKVVPYVFVAPFIVFFLFCLYVPADHDGDHELSAD